MATTLRVILDQIVAPVPGPLGRYTRDLGRAIVAAAPAGCEVEAIVSSSLPEDYERVRQEVPGLSGLYRTTLARRELAAAWQLGITTSPGSGMIHGTSLFAPLRKHDRAVDANQVVVTVHDVLAWTHPEALTAASVAWQKGMLKRARKHADAVVVPTHALAERLAHVADFGDRVRVIGTAPRAGLVIGPDAGQRAARLGPPPRVHRGARHPRAAQGARRRVHRPRAAGACPRCPSWCSAPTRGATSMSRPWRRRAAWTPAASAISTTSTPKTSRS